MQQTSTTISVKITGAEIRVLKTKSDLVKLVIILRMGNQHVPRYFQLNNSLTNNN